MCQERVEMPRVRQFVVATASGHGRDKASPEGPPGRLVWFFGVSRLLPVPSDRPPANAVVRVLSKGEVTHGRSFR